MSDLADWLEDARIERMLLERRPSGQTGFVEPGMYDAVAEDEFSEDEPEDA